MLKCNCNELCFYCKKISITEIDGKKYIQTHNINKCNRLLSDNSRKKPCYFNSKILVEEKAVNVENVQEKIKIDTPNKDKNVDKILTYRDIRNKINNMFEYYYIKSYNYFGNLNYYLKLIGYQAHDPTIESLSELKRRLSRKPNNVNKIYMNKESYFSHTIEEFDYDYENEQQIFKKIKRGDNPLEWTKNEIVQDILKMKVLKHKKSSKSKKSTKSIKSTNSHKVTLIKELLKNNDNEENYELEYKEEDKEEEDKEEDKEEDEEDEEEDEEEDKDEKNSQNLKDNEFDVEEFSDDDNNYDDNNYEDFSD